MKRKTEISDEIFSSNSTFSIPLQTAKDTYDLNNVSLFLEIIKQHRTNHSIKSLNRVIQSSYDFISAKFDEL
jgi:hypothetical protein